MSRWGGRVAKQGPPDTSRGGRSRVRTYFDADRAEQSVGDARTAVEAIER